MHESDIDATFSALAHPVRRRVIDLLTGRPGMTVGAVASHFEMSRIGVMKHLRILEDAELVLSEKVGRERRLYFNPMPIQQIYDRWTTQLTGFWAEQIADIKDRVEGRQWRVEKRHA
jgi:predicted transcriptional regulator